MNKKKTSNPVRLIAFFLVGVLLLCTFGFTVDGWQIKNEDDLPASLPEDKNPNLNDQDSTIPPDQLPEDEKTTVPEFTNPLTGLECSSESVNKIPMGFVLEGNEKYYGISNSEIVVEIPIENGKTRYISFIYDTNNLWKIGAISPLRGYIGNVIKYFGGAAFFDGYDDRTTYDCCNLLGRVIDLSLKQEYGYTEQGELVYSNRDLVDLALSGSSINNDSNTDLVLPYSFSDFGSTIEPTENVAKNIGIFYSDQNVTRFTYNVDTGMYEVKKNESAFSDALSGNSTGFKNCFILFADSITYDTSDYSQMVMHTVGSGSGYYITDGGFYEIKWSATTAGIMTFCSQSGEKLVINRGTSYIAYVKSSMKNSVIIT